MYLNGCPKCIIYKIIRKWYVGNIVKPYKTTFPFRRTAWGKFSDTEHYIISLFICISLMYNGCVRRLVTDKWSYLYALQHTVLYNQTYTSPLPPATPQIHKIHMKGRAGQEVSQYTRGDSRIGRQGERRLHWQPSQIPLTDCII